MPVVINLDIMLAKRRMSLTELCEKMDITYSNLQILKSNRAKAIKLSTLAQLCIILECRPGDLLDFMEDEEYERLFGKDDKDEGE